MTEPFDGTSTIGVTPFLDQPVQFRQDHRREVSWCFIGAVDPAGIAPAFQRLKLVIGHQHISWLAMLRDRNRLTISCHRHGLDVTQQFDSRKLFHGHAPFNLIGIYKLFDYFAIPAVLRM